MSTRLSPFHQRPRVFSLQSIWYGIRIIHAHFLLRTTHFPADLRSVLCCSQPQQCIVINAPIMLRHNSPILFLAPRPFLALTMSTANTDSSGGDRKRERSPSPKHSLSWKEELTYCRSSTEPLPMSGSDGNAALISSRHNFQRS